MSDIWALLELTETKTAQAVALSTKLRGGRDGNLICKTTMRHNSADIKLAAPRIAGSVYLILCNEGDLRGTTFVEYSLKNPPADIHGRSAELALSLGLAIKIRSAQPEFEPVAVAATGTVDNAGNVGIIGWLPEKIRAALEVLPKGGKILYPAANQLDVAPELEQDVNNQSITLIPVTTLSEAMRSVGIELHRTHEMPFPGLNAYRYEDYPVFFGRESESQKISDLLLLEQPLGKNGKMLLVLGASGSGKSSLVQAGVLPELRQRIQKSGQILHWSLLQPRDISTKDQETFWHYLVNKCRKPHGLQVATPNPLPKNSDAFMAWISEEIKQLQSIPGAKTIRYLWIIDQLEELFTLGLTAEIESEFTNLLCRLSAAGHLILLNLRSDFFGKFQSHTTINDCVDNNLYSLGLPNNDAIDQMIQGPVLLAGCTYELNSERVSLATRLREDLNRNIAALPLLGFILQKLYEESKDNTLTYACYEQEGGIHGVIGKRADKTYNGLSVAAQAALPRIIRALTTVADSEGTQVVAQSALLAQFPENSGERELIDAFTKERLLVIEGGDERLDGTIIPITVRVAHEALLRNWKRAEDLIEEDINWLPVRTRLETEARHWASAKERQQELLLPAGLRLNQATQLHKSWNQDLNEQTCNYIKASEEAEEKRLKQIETEKRTKLQRTQIFASVTSVLLIVTVVLYVMVWQERDNSNQQRNAALSLIDRIQTNLYKKLEPIGKLDLLSDITKYVLDYFNNFPSISNDSTALDSQAMAFINSGDIKLAKKDFVGAKENYTKAQIIYQDLTIKDATNIEWQHGLIRSYLKIGNVFYANDKPDYENAKKCYKKAKSMSELLVPKYPNNADLRSDLAKSCNNIGIVLGKQGNEDEALINLRQGLGEFEQLVKQDKDNDEWQRQIWYIPINISAILRDKGKFSEAITTLQQALEICDSAVKKNPSNMQWKRDLGFIYYQFGLVWNDQGNLEKARTDYNNCIKIREYLVKHDHENVEWQKELEHVQNKVK